MPRQVTTPTASPSSLLRLLPVELLELPLDRTLLTAGEEGVVAHRGSVPRTCENSPQAQRGSAPAEPSPPGGETPRALPEHHPVHHPPEPRVPASLEHRGEEGSVPNPGPFRLDRGRDLSTGAGDRVDRVREHVLSEPAVPAPGEEVESCMPVLVVHTGREETLRWEEGATDQRSSGREGVLPEHERHPDRTQKC